MRILIFCSFILFAGSLLFTSCNDDLPFVEENESFDRNFPIESRDQGVDIPGLYHNGQWFVVESLDQLPGIVATLEDMSLSYEAPEDEEDIDGFVDDDPILEAFELSYGHQSLRRVLLEDLHNKLEEGQMPVDALNSQDDLDLTEVEQSLLNASKVIQVGLDLYYYYSNKILIKVSNEDAGSLNDIIDGGLVQAYFKPNVSFVTTNTFATGGDSSANKKGDCTAKFTSAAPSLDPNGSYAVVFTWAEQANIADWPMVQLTWDFGDGNTQVVFNNGVVTHTYAAPGTYTVTLTVSSSNPECNTSYTSSITVNEITAPLDCENYFCTALNLVGALGPKAVGNLLTDQSLTPNNEMMLNLTNLMSAIFNHCTETELDNIEWTIEGQTFYGPSVLYPVPCPDGMVIDGTISWGNCSVSFKIETPTTCTIADCKQDWDDVTYNNGKNQIEYKTKTVSKKADLFFGLLGNNKIQAKMAHFKNKNGKWKLQRKDLDIETSGTLAFNLSCNCEGDFDVDPKAGKNNRKRLTLTKKYNNYSEIHMYGTYKWFADFIVDGNTILSNWDASQYCK